MGRRTLAWASPTCLGRIIITYRRWSTMTRCSQRRIKREVLGTIHKAATRFEHNTVLPLGCSQRTMLAMTPRGAKRLLAVYYCVHSLIPPADAQDARSRTVRVCYVRTDRLARVAKGTWCIPRNQKRSETDFWNRDLRDPRRYVTPVGCDGQRKFAIR